MFSGQEQILDQMGTITLVKDGLKLYNDVDSGKSSKWFSQIISLKNKKRKYWRFRKDFTSSWDEFTETSINQFQEIERFEKLSDDHYRFIMGLLISQERKP